MVVFIAALMLLLQLMTKEAPASVDGYSELGDQVEFIHICIVYIVLVFHVTKCSQLSRI